MTEEEKKTVETFEEKLRRLIFLYKDQKKENERLAGLLEEKSKEINEANERFSELEKEYTNLKLAKIINIDDNEANNAKERLSKLVQEIDQCIALLNE